MKPPLYTATVTEPVDTVNMKDGCSAKTYRRQMLHKIGHGMADMLFFYSLAVKGVK